MTAHPSGLTRFASATFAQVASDHRRMPGFPSWPTRAAAAGAMVNLAMRTAFICPWCSGPCRCRAASDGPSAGGSAGRLVCVRRPVTPRTPNSHKACVVAFTEGWAVSSDIGINRRRSS
jgi:hypothetical protein